MPPCRSVLKRIPAFWLVLGLLLVLAAAGTALGLLPAPPELAGAALACGLGWRLGVLCCWCDAHDPSEGLARHWW